VEQRDRPGLLDGFVDRVDVTIVGVEGLTAGVELETACTTIDQPPDLTRRPAAAVRIDCPEGDDHVRVLGSEVTQLIVAHLGQLAGGPTVVHRECHAHHVQLAIVAGEVAHGRPGHVCLEVLGHRLVVLRRLLTHRLVHRGEDVCVDIDRDDVVIQHCLRHHCSCMIRGLSAT
jgi:hypothetical protein